MLFPIIICVMKFHRKKIDLQGPKIINNKIFWGGGHLIKITDFMLKKKIRFLFRVKKISGLEKIKQLFWRRERFQSSHLETYVPQCYFLL